MYGEVVSGEINSNSKGAFGTQPCGLYREVVSVERSKSKSIAKEFLGPNQAVCIEGGQSKSTIAKELLGPNQVVFIGKVVSVPEVKIKA